LNNSKRYRVAFEPHLDSINKAFNEYFAQEKDIDFSILDKPQRKGNHRFFLVKALTYRVSMFFKFIRDYDLVHINSAKFGIVAYLASFFNCRYIYTIHFATADERKGSLKNLIYYILETKLLKLVARRASYVTTVSEFCKVELKKTFGIDTVVVHNGYDDAAFRLPNVPRMESEAPSFISVGRLTEYKKPLNVIRFFKKIKAVYPRAKLLLIGDGDLHDVVVAEIKDNADIQLIRKVMFDQIPAYYHTADYFISACESEAFGLVTLEALGCGVYPLVPWKGAFPEIFLNSVFSYDINEPGDVILPAKAVLEPYREHILQRFKWKDKVGLYYELYNKAIIK